MSNHQKALLHLKDIIEHLTPKKIDQVPKHEKFKEDFGYALHSAKAALLSSINEFQISPGQEIPFEELLKKNKNFVAGLLDQVREFRYDSEPQHADLPALIDLAEQALAEVMSEIQARYNLEMNALAGDEPKKSIMVSQNKQKTLLALSGDQIAIFLRAAKEEDIIIARSVSAVFNTVIPHLSTRERETLSTTLRAKAYQAEDREKEILIDLLFRIIARIRTF